MEHLGVIISVGSIHLWRGPGNSFLLDFPANSRLFIMD